MNFGPVCYSDVLIYIHKYDQIKLLIERIGRKDAFFKIQGCYRQKASAQSG
jgi:hypothetical protein